MCCCVVSVVCCKSCVVCWCSLQLFVAAVVRRCVVCGVMSGAIIVCGSLLVISLLRVACWLVFVSRCCVFAVSVSAGCDLVC